MLYIMRHGRTDWNNARRLQGRTDIPLNAQGLQMAEKARGEYAGVHFDVCFCSPLTRAVQTAQILLRGRDVPIITDGRLVEMSFGACEGSCLDDPDNPIRTLFSSPESYVPAEGGESLDELFARTGQFLDERVKPLLAQGRDVLIVGHGAMNSSIVCRVKGLPISDFWSAGIENCRLMRLV